MGLYERIEGYIIEDKDGKIFTIDQKWNKKLLHAMIFDSKDKAQEAVKTSRRRSLNVKAYAVRWEITPMGMTSHEIKLIPLS